MTIHKQVPSETTPIYTTIDEKCSQSVHCYNSEKQQANLHFARIMQVFSISISYCNFSILFSLKNHDSGKVGKKIERDWAKQFRIMVLCYIDLREPAR